jgi:acetyltransferase-like isoleucine patch superfamily enzyme
MKFKDFIWIMKQKRNSKISLKIFLKGSENITIGAQCKLHRYCELDASNRGRIILGDKVTLNPYVFLQANVNGYIEIGNNTELNNFTIVNSGGKIIIGQNVLIGPKVNIIAYNHSFESIDIPIKKQKSKTAPIIIEDDVWIGANVTILPGVKIGKGAVIGANSVVNKDIEPFSVNVGVPCKKIKERG